MRQDDFSSSAVGGAELNVVVTGGEPLHLPEGLRVFRADFIRDGADLVLRDAGHADVRLVDYFTQGTPDLIAGNDAVMRGELAEKLAGPAQPGQYAQAGVGTDTDPIGQVETLNGTAFATRADGTRVELEVGSKIYPNDVIETTDGSTTAVTFVDGTIFTLASASRMIIDSLIYDANATSGNGGAFSLVQGGFVFIAGEVARTGGMDVTTPTATMGVRGTTVLVEITTEDGVSTVQVSLNRDPDGGIGKIELFDLDGVLIATIDDIDTKWIVSPIEGETREVVRTADELADDETILLDAARAYALAFERVSAGGTFVELSSRGGQNGNNAPQNNTGVEGNDSNPDPSDERGDDLTGGGTGGTSGPGTTGSDGGEGRTDVSGTPANAAPTIGADSFEVTEDGYLSENFLKNDKDPDGGTLKLIGHTNPSHGTLYLGAGPIENETNPKPGDFVYTPDENFNGTDSFTYTVSDGQGGKSTGTVRFTVSSVEDVPLAVDDAITLTEDDGPLLFNPLGNDTDGDGDTLTITDMTAPTNGELWQNEEGSGYFYVPDGDFNGTDTFSYTISDGNGNEASATVTFTISPAPDAPVTTDDAQTGSEDAATIIINVLDNDDDADGDALTIVGWTDPSHGSVAPDVATLGEGQTPFEGNFVYTPDADFFGTDTFTYTVSDGNGGTDTATVTVTVTPVNDLPDAQSDTYTVDEDSTSNASANYFQVLGNDSDVEGDVSVSDWTDPDHGTLSYDNEGGFFYAPDENYHGDDSFTYTVTDSDGATSTATVSITVASVNDAPDTTDADIETVGGTAFDGTIMAEDVDGDALSFAVGTGPSHGSVDLNETTGEYTYTPDEGYVGTDSFTVTASDPDGASDTATVTVENTGYVSPLGDTVAMGINEDPVGDRPAGSVLISRATQINLSIALDASGSIGDTGWQNIEAAVSAAIEGLSDIFADADTSVEIQLIQYASTSTVIGVYDLVPDTATILADIEAMVFTGGGTNWGNALEQSKAFFDTQPEGEVNLIYFVTDGVPSDNWQVAHQALLDAPYEVDIQTFGIGSGYATTDLQSLDSDGTPQAVTSTTALLEALEQSPLFAAQLISFDLSLEVNGEDYGQQADQDSSALTQTGLAYNLAIADIPEIAWLLGEENIFTATAVFDFDGNIATTDDQVMLTSTQSLSKRLTALEIDGSDGNDLLLGSDFADSINGAGGRDILIGFDGNDVIAGGEGDDTIFAGAGDDILIDDAGEETLDGGTGRDVLRVLADANAGSDLLPTLSGSNIEAIDIDNGVSESLVITLEDVLNLSNEVDTELDALLTGQILGDSATIYGDVNDFVELLDGETGYWHQDGSVSDGNGNTLAIYQYVNISDGITLATLGIDDEINIVTPNEV